MAALTAERLQNAFSQPYNTDLTALTNALSNEPYTVEIDREAFVKAQAQSLPEEFTQAVFQEILNRMIQEKLSQNDIAAVIEIITERITYLKADTLIAISEHPDAFVESQELILAKLPNPLPSEVIEAFSEWSEDFTQKLNPPTL